MADIADGNNYDLNAKHLMRATFVVVPLVFYMLFHAGQLVERLRVKKELTKGLDLRINYKIKEIREGEKGNGKEKK